MDAKGHAIEGAIMMHWYGDDMGWWGYGTMAIVTAVFWALVIIGMIALVKYLSGDDQTQRDAPLSSSPADVLAARFARGELSETEYRDRIAALREVGRP